MSKAKNTLDLLFESRARVKMLKFLFRNMGSSFTVRELSARVQEPVATVKKEISRFVQIGLIVVHR